MAYTSQDKIEDYIGRDLSDDEQSLSDLLISGVSDLIDSYCARTFEAGRPNSASTVDATKGDLSSNAFEVFDGGGVEIFFDQPLQTDTSVSGVIAPYVGYVDLDTGTWNLIDPSEYVFYPHNSKKKTSVMRNIGIFPYGNQNIYAYGTFEDFVTAPDGITLATTIICADILNLPDGISAESIEGYSRTFNNNWNPTVQKILDIYRRVVI